MKIVTENRVHQGRYANWMTSQPIIPRNYDNVFTTTLIHFTA